MPKVSVIVPVYKVESYLRKCVDSILGQSFSDFEVILVDDGSPDNCGAICDDYATRDQRVKVIHKINGGLSDARNVGLDVAIGQYICFVDSDDWIEQDLLKDNVAVLEHSGADLSIFGFTEIYSDREVVHTQAKDPKKTPNDKYYNFHKTPVMAWCKLYRANLWQNIRFPVGMRHEDDYIHPQIMALANKVEFLEKPYYVYNKTNQSSIMQTLNYFEDRYVYFLCAMQFVKCTENVKDETYVRSLKKAYDFAFKAWNCNLVTTVLTTKQQKEVEAFIEKYSHDAKKFLSFWQRKYLWGYQHFRFLNKVKGYIYLKKYQKRSQH